MSESPPSDPEKPPGTQVSGCVRWTAIMLIIAMLVTGLLAWRFLTHTADLARWSGNLLVEIGDLLDSREIREEFEQELLRVTSTQGDVLELATVESDERFSRYDMRSVLNDYVYLGTTVSEIQVPVVYRYHLRLSDLWQIEIRDGVCEVVAPEIRPSLPPAIRTDRMEKKSKAGWLRFNAEQNLQELEKSLTPKIEKRAGDEVHLALAREPSRESVAAFVRKWILETHPEIDDIPVRVRFPDELTDQEPSIQSSSDDL